MRALRLAIGLGCIALAAAAVAATAWARRTLDAPYRGWEGPTVRVEVEAGWSARRILDQLERQGVIARADLARLYMRWALDDASLRAGEYEFDEPLSTPAVLQRLLRGDVVTYPVTVIEGLDLEETVQALATAGLGDTTRFLEAARDPSPIADLDPEAGNLEGYLFPSTYSFARGTSERAIVAKMVATFREQLDELPARPPDVGLRQLVTLASIVEKEAQLDAERPLIAGVYTNRLRRGIPLAADPTVIYALKLAGTWDGNIRRDDLRRDHPYNTYVRAGLPPGPICSMGLKSLIAAAAPASTDDLYFVSRNDGSHVFSETLAEHNRNVEEWQKRYWRRKWAREGR